MKITTQWLDGRTFVSANEHGNSIVIDGTPAAEGWKRGVSPFETLMMGVSGCTSTDMVAALKSHPNFVDCLTEIEAERAPNPPKVFIKVHIHFKIIVKDTSDETFRQLVADAAKDSLENGGCSACIVMGKAVNITYNFELSSR